MVTRKKIICDSFVATISVAKSTHSLYKKKFSSTRTLRRIQGKLRRKLITEEVARSKILFCKAIIFRYIFRHNVLYIHNIILSTHEIICMYICVYVLLYIIKYSFAK